MKGNQKFKKDEAGIIGVDFILAAVLILIVSAMAIAIVFPMIGGVPIAATDKTLQTATGYGTKFTPTANATITLISSTGTALGLAPMMAIAAIAAGIVTLLLYAFATAGRPTL